MSINPFELQEQGDAKLRELGTLTDKIYLHGFGSALTPLHQVQESDAFQAMKQEVAATNDWISTLAKAEWKIKTRTPSISNHELRNGQELGRAVLRSVYDAYRDFGFEKEGALHCLTNSLEHVEINRQSGSFSTFSAEVQHPQLRKFFEEYGARMPGAYDIALPLQSFEGGISGEMADVLRKAIGTMRQDMIVLVEKPKAEMLFEKLTKEVGRHL